MRRRHEDDAPAPLAHRDLDILLDGPWAVGLELRSPEANHARLRALWARHEPEVRAAAAGQEIWFIGRDAFVRMLHALRSGFDSGGFNGWNNCSKCGI